MRGGGSRMALSEYGPDPELEGMTLAEAAARQQLGEYECAVELLRAANGRVSMVFHTLEEEDVTAIFPRSYVMVASDGSALAPYGRVAVGAYPHPRNYGCFPKVLGEFVREKKLVTLEEALRKMTSLPAARFRLEKRGQLQPGWAADVTIFDPRTVADTTSFADPQRYPEGIVDVLVNGELVVEKGEHTGRQPGRVLYAGRAVAA